MNRLPLSPCAGPCAVDKRLRERSDECLCRELADRVEAGDLVMLEAVPVASLRRAIQRQREAGRPRVAA